MPTTEQLNALPEDDARTLLAGCLAVPRWVDEVLSGRPYAGRAELIDAADSAARMLDASEVDTAVAGHPRIGERAGAGHNAAASEREQAGIGSDAEVLARLTEGNAAYEERFDRVFLIRAAGRTAEEVLLELERRLANDDTTEEREVADNLRQIALLRLEELVGP